jgi:hypothetical protein
MAADLASSISPPLWLSGVQITDSTAAKLVIFWLFLAIRCLRSGSAAPSVCFVPRAVQHRQAGILGENGFGLRQQAAIEDPRSDCTILACWQLAHRPISRGLRPSIN